MIDPVNLETLVHDARRFCADLAGNNTKDWFNAQKPIYESQLKAPAQTLLDIVAADLTRTFATPWVTKLFRAHRDVRFSKDKRPYNTHLHMLWSRKEGAPVGLFFGIAPDYVSVGGGIMGFDKVQLTEWRRALDTDLASEVHAAVEAAAMHGFALRDPELKRVPPPFAKDHPAESLLRRKGLVAWREVPDTEWSDPVAALHHAADSLAALYTALDRAL
ncbi:MAG: TIGR02453 family protein [Pseudomonadota bacterium]